MVLEVVMVLGLVNIGVWEIISIVALLVACIYAVYDCINNPRFSSRQRLIWLCIILIVPLLGAACYLLFNKSSYNTRKRN